MTPTGMALYPFVPSGPQFARSVAFFQELGFEKIWESPGLAGLRFGGAYFILQEIDVPAWQDNQMITFEVDDLDGYWREISARSLPDRFRAKLKPPTDYAWGREIHIIDPVVSVGMSANRGHDIASCPPARPVGN